MPEKTDPFSRREKKFEVIATVTTLISAESEAEAMRLIEAEPDRIVWSKPKVATVYPTGPD